MISWLVLAIFSIYVRHEVP